MHVCLSFLGENDVETLLVETHLKSIRKLQDLDDIQAIKRNARILLENTTICPFKWRRNMFICFHCDHEFLDLSNLRQHNLIVHESQCPVQIQHAISEYSKNKSVLVKVDITDTCCKICGQRMDFADVKNHLNEEHKTCIDLNVKDGVLPFKVSKDNYTCALCDKKYDEYKTLNHHMNEHYQNFICDQCGTGFITKSRLRIHAFSHETGSFACEICNKIFRSMNSKNEHFAHVHKKVKRHRCLQCREAFSNYYQRNKHMSLVHGMKLKEFKCSYCTKVFTLSGKLGVHIRTVHLKIKRHACSICEWKFYSKSELKDHMIRHSGDRKYQCNVCKKFYTRKYTLTEHMRIHENDRRFVCSACGASFVQKCSLKHHIKVNHPSLKQNDMLINKLS